MKPSSWKSMALAVVCVLASQLNTRAQTNYYDLVTTSVTNVTIGGVIFSWEFIDPASGTGNFETYLRLQDSKEFERGYNTSGLPVPFDDASGPWTKDITIADLRVSTNIFGVNYATIGVDLNEPNDANHKYLSFDAFKVYVGPTGSLTNTDLSTLGTLIYDMDAGGEVSILADVNRNHSSGSGYSDVNIYIPTSLLNTFPTNYYFYSYVEFGAAGLVGTTNYIANSGFEELNLHTGLRLWNDTIPEPGAGMLTLAGLATLCGRRRRRRS